MKFTTELNIIHHDVVSFKHSATLQPRSATLPCQFWSYHSSICDPKTRVCTSVTYTIIWHCTGNDVLLECTYTSTFSNSCRSGIRMQSSRWRRVVRLESNIPHAWRRFKTVLSFKVQLGTPWLGVGEYEDDSPYDIVAVHSDASLHDTLEV